jgi:hypothetical protein
VGPDVAVRWEAPADAREPSLAARRSLDEWALARGFHVFEPRAAALPVLTPDEAVADTVEEEIEHARDALIALDTAAVERALSKADALLRAHPELPQAAWLEAEVLRTWGTRWQRLSPRDATRAAAAWAHAAGLDGGRATGVGEVLAEKAPSVTATLAFNTLGEGPFVVRLDGVVVPGPLLIGTRGEHQLTVTRGDALVWAAWVELGDGGTVHVALPEPAACAREDLERAHVTDREVVAEGVTCPDWVFARQLPLADEGLSLATCAKNHCGGFFRWKVGAMGPVLPPARAGVSHWPVWATVVVVSASAVAVGAATLAATGVFRPTRDEPVFTTAPLHTSSLPVQLRFGQ